jgi:hypothetical protein
VNDCGEGARKVTKRAMVLLPPQKKMEKRERKNIRRGKVREKGVLFQIY